ncbi:hypothetical protein OHA25_40785 [Nonomuraea sp. NBC_00507]|uniref:hypothetical protein n=1 Tax=Nonomuraea sp. NBC_00507 TaxID=2976002 RepID=UPI002E1872F7
MRIVAYFGATLLVAAVALVAILASARTHGERFADSVGQMEAVARTLRESDELDDPMIGKLTFDAVFKKDGVVNFQLGTDLGPDPYGYVWSPDGRRRTPNMSTALGISGETERRRRPHLTRCYVLGCRSVAAGAIVRWRCAR